MAERSFIIRFRMAPGDVSLVTALVRDLKRTYGDRYAVDVRTNFPAFWRRNPHLTPLKEGRSGVEFVRLDDKKAMTKGIRQGGEDKTHFLTYFHREFERLTKVHVPCLEPKADLHLSPEENEKPLISGRYWIIVPGGKLDMTNKIWSQVRYQQVVDRLRPWGLRFVQEGAVRRQCAHPPLEGVLNLVGRTSVRDLIVNVRHAEGVICGVTLQMHLAAAFNKPCVVLGGGREGPWWEAYVDDWKAFGPRAAPVRTPHRFLHVLGLLKCCKVNGCWKQRVTRLNDRSPNDGSLCYLPTTAEASQIIPKCLDMISADHVCEAAMSYYEDGVLDPIGKPRGTYRLPPSAIPLDAEASPLVVDSPAPEPIDEPALTRITELEAEGAAKPERGQAHAFPMAIQPVAASPRPNVSSGVEALWNHPSVGGKLTVCVLLYGKEYANLHRRCLNSIVGSIPEHRLDLRVAMNQTGVETQTYLRTIPVAKTYVDYQSRRKYPAMREMFWDAQDPLDSKWVVWFDDDSYARDSRWVRALLESIVKAPANVAMLGQKMRHKLRPPDGGRMDPRAWFRAAPWFRGQAFRNQQGRKAPNGDYVHFVVGGFWAIRRDAIRACDVPDSRLNHNGGDICIGEQMHQGDLLLGSFNDGKKFVHTSNAPRRGHSDKEFPWRVASSTFA